MPIRIQQDLPIRTVKYVIPSRYQAAKLLHARPRISNVKLVCVSPDIKDLRRIRLHSQELLGKRKHTVKFTVMIYGGMKTIKILLRREGMR